MTVALANELNRRGHDVTIMVQSTDGPAKLALNGAVPVIDMALPTRGKLKRLFRIVKELRKAMRPGRYDVLAAVCADRSQLAALSTLFLRKRIPLVSIVHNTLSQETEFIGRKPLSPFFNRRYDRVIAVSEGIRRDYIRVCHAAERQVTTVYNPVIDSDFARRAAEPLTHPWLDEERAFVTMVQAGRLCEQKNHRLMLRALNLLNRTGDDCRLILLGDGELRGELESEAEQLGLKNRIEFAGYAANPLPYFKKADMVVLSSDYEGLPTVLIEALACGAKIVSTDCPSGPREILKDGTLGVLVERGNPYMLAEGIRKARAWNPDRERMRARAQDFTLSKSVDRYEDVFIDVLKKKEEERLRHGNR